jgi:hypothetical protein
MLRSWLRSRLRSVLQQRDWKGGDLACDSQVADMRTLISAISILLLATGCSRSISVELPAQALTVVMYSQGKASQRCVIAPNSDKFHNLADFIKQNTDGWHKRSADYMPSLVVIGSDINMYFMDDLLVMNYNGGEYSRNVAPGSYAFLSCGAK